MTTQTTMTTPCTTISADDEARLIRAVQTGLTQESRAAAVELAAAYEPEIRDVAHAVRLARLPHVEQEVGAALARILRGGDPETFGAGSPARILAGYRDGAVHLASMAE